MAKKLYTPSWGDKPHNLRTDAVVTKDLNKVISDGIIKSGHHTAYTTGTGKKKCRNTGTTDEQMAQKQQVKPISNKEENECKVTQSTRNRNKWNY
jgi:hypothetical protein